MKWPCWSTKDYRKDREQRCQYCRASHLRDFQEKQMRRDDEASRESGEREAGELRTHEALYTSHQQYRNGLHRQDRISA